MENTVADPIEKPTKQLPKYELDITGTTLAVEGRTQYRIVALRNFGNVKAGDVGGFIESESNLSHEGLCWVYDDAHVYEQAKLYGDARMTGRACLFGVAEAYDNARIQDNARVGGAAEIREDARVKSNVYVAGSAVLGGTVRAAGSCRITGDAALNGNVAVQGHAEISGNVRLGGNVQIRGRSFIGGDVRLFGSEVIRVDGFIMNRNSCMTFSNVGSEHGTLTVYKNTDGGLTVTRGCYDGTADDFINTVKRQHKESPITHEYELMIEIARSRLSRISVLEEDDGDDI